jgi:hypothetical protein
MEKRFDLPAQCQKSFYGNAIVIDSGNRYLLQSYATIVASIPKTNKHLVKHWNGYSATTMKHINGFCRFYGVPTINKKIWDSMDAERR